MVTAGAYVEGALGNKKKHIQKNKKETNQLMKFSEKNINILLAHYPPFGYFDKVKYKGENPMNGKHIGFKGYTEFIKKNKPDLFICGHMHEYQGKTKIGKTAIVTTGSAKQGKAAMIEFDEKIKRIKNVRFIK
jgi:Icc-related predicted phosphoesterase